MQLINSEISNQTQKRVDKNFLDLFGKLANNNSEKRIKACVNILNILRRKQGEAENKNEPTKELQYCVERLVKGLASSRESARLGFSLLLTELLKHFDIILIEDVLDLVKQHLSLTPLLEKKDAIFGQLFAYSSIVRSGRLANHSHLSYVIEALNDLWLGRSYIMIASYEILLNILSQINEETFSENVWPVLKKKLAFEREESSADLIWPLFVCVRMFPVVTKKFLKKYWSADLFSSDSIDHIKKAIKQTTACLPLLHPLCSEVLKFCIARNDREEIWKALIDDNLCETDHPEKAYVGFEMVKKVLQTTQKKKIVKRILTSKFCVMFSKSLVNAKHPMNPAAVYLANFLCNFVKESKDPDIQICILKIFLHPSIPFYQIIKTKQMLTIVQNLLPNAVKSFCELLKSVAIKKAESKEEEKDAVHNIRFQAVLQIGSLVNHPATISDLEWRLSVTKFLFLHSFFNLHTPTENILHCEQECTEIRPHLRESFTNSFYKAVNSLYHRTDQHITPIEQFLQHLLSLSEYAEQLMTATEFVSTHFPLGKVQESWQQMKSIISKLMKQSKKDGRANESNAFYALFLELGFHLFREPEHISGVLEELHICCKKALHQRRHSDVIDDNEPSWISVVIDILLSLLSRSSHHLRCIVNTVFPLLCPFIMKESLQPVLDVISPEKEDGEPMLVDEGEEDVQFDSGSSSNESDLEDNDGKVDTKFRAKVKEALGPAAEESDAESIVLSDSEMFKLDDSLAEAFRSRVRTGHTQLNVEDKTMLHFRVRCLDLVTAYLKSNPPLYMVLHCIQPLISAYEFGHKNKNQSQLLNKAVSTLQTLVKIKKFEHLDDVEMSELKEHLKTLVSKCHKETNMAVANKLYSLCVFMVLCFRRLEAQKSTEKKSKKHPKYLNIYISALETFVKGSSSNMLPQFFVSLMESCSDLAWNFIGPCKEYAFDTDIRIFKRTQCLSLIIEALKFSKGQTSVTTEQWLDIGNSLIPNAVESLKKVLDNPEIKPVYLTELLNVIYAAYFIIKEKTKKSLLERHKDILPLLNGMSKLQVKKLMKKGSSIRRKLILALGGRIPANENLNPTSLEPKENNSEVNNIEVNSTERLNDSELNNSEAQESTLNISEATSSDAESKQVKRKAKAKKNAKKKKLDNNSEESPCINCFFDEEWK
ncbi:myb-binding protein 1A-like protein [Trichonephila clavata]|uniref:Myb-binding protein 1A-like protein n=1 Tax=Trichonephila clavata TaxID=2740835 RepID=A0A8X6GK99_TRICU|nr:myb-binding protein 1A-like protein [Trichonephila clavata]